MRWNEFDLQVSICRAAQHSTEPAQWAAAQQLGQLATKRLQASKQPLPATNKQQAAHVSQEPP